MQLIPAIDLREGRCVRLLRGDFGAETCYEVKPRELLERYQAMGAAWLHVVDLDSARDGALRNRKLIARLADAGDMQLQVGGGARSMEAISALFDSGAVRVVIGSAALHRAGEVNSWLKCFGPERVCLAFDVALDASRAPRVRTHGWTHETGVSLWEAVRRYPKRNLRHVLCTDISRDGALTGPNLELYRTALQRFPNLLWQASGGVRHAADLEALARIGVSAAVCGKALVENRIGLKELRPFLPDASSPASTSVTA
ncbi:MAG: HisA/HisF-related TIM barrel protein [Steroidobacteraceae bacterium]